MPETQIMLRVQASRDDDAAELDKLADELRPLAQHVVAPSDGPPMKYDADMVQVIATLGSAGVVSGVVTMVTTFLLRHRGRKATIDFKGQKIELTGYNGDEVVKILHEQQSKH